MFKLISTTLVLCALSAGAARAQTPQTTATQQQDRAAREQAERDRKQAERERKERDKDAKKEPGTRCGRWKRGKA
jgi:Ni/Co efflux regulator RcnB